LDILSQRASLALLLHSNARPIMSKLVENFGGREARHPRH
jgi:hypothetical protein